LQVVGGELRTVSLGEHLWGQAIMLLEAGCGCPEIPSSRRGVGIQRSPYAALVRVVELDLIPSADSLWGQTHHRVPGEAGKAICILVYLPAPNSSPSHFSCMHVARTPWAANSPQALCCQTVADHRVPG
jgi:hypothetical protein